MEPQVIQVKALSKRGHKRTRRHIFGAFLEACRTQGVKKSIVTDGDERVLSYGDLRRAAFALSSPLAAVTRKSENVGILLPTGAGAVIAMLSTHAAGRIPAMLNFTAGVKNLQAAAQTAQIRYVITAHKFVEIGGLQPLIKALSGTVEFLYLEDMREALGTRAKLRAVLGPYLPKIFTPQAAPDDPGVILFTSGTEGVPKGVVLSHANILANIEQIEEHVDLLPSDIFFNPLPTFHCYGLTAGTLWPLLSGYPVVLHPSPLQTKTVAKRILQTRSSVLFATDTFLQQYMRASGDGGLSSLRIAVCGAERVRDETRKTAKERFAFEVLEGYGVTECAPVLAANQPGDIRAGTIGKMLPGLEIKLMPIDGLKDAGALWVRGPNVMSGYMSQDKPGQVIAPEGGWHNTGDVVSIDRDGYYVIRGRIKRFAKIGGEMVSLTVVENCAAAVWPDSMHAAAIAPDPKKGEQIILVTEEQDAKRQDLLTWAQSHGVPEISVPKTIVQTDSLPVLGTGKLDYVSITKIAKDALKA